MSRVALESLGPVEEEVMQALEQAVGESLGLLCRRRPPRPRPDFAWDGRRGQYDSTRILRDVFERRPLSARCVLAVTEVDLFLPMLTFVFGQAQLGGPAALISLARLRQEFYGLPPDPWLLRRRAAKEALHELGHSFALIHCPDESCALSLSSDITQVDAKEGEYCHGCRALLRERLEVPGVEMAAGTGEEDDGS